MHLHCWAEILRSCRGVCQCVSVLMRLMGGRGPLFESLQAALQMKKHTSDCLGDHMPLKLCSQTGECQRAGIWKRRMKGIRLQALMRELMGADGNGATVAELRLIAALDKESI